MIRRFLLPLVLTAGSLGAQSPSPSPAPAASPSAAPSPTPTATPSPSPTPLPPPPSMRQLINDLSDEDLNKALEKLNEEFLDRSMTEEKARQRALLEGIVRRLAPGAAIVSADHQAQAAEGVPFLAEILDSHIAYLRVGALTKNNLAQLDAALTGYADRKIDAVILDLRGVPASSDFETAADFARRFAPKGKLLFSIQKPSAKQERIFTSNQDPIFQGILIVLTDSDTAGAAEAIAATLRQNAAAMIIGSDTTGEAVEFAEIPLGGKALLKVAVAQVILPESGPIYPKGVKPDVTVSLPRETRMQIFAESKEKGVSQFVFETERRRMNEASLVANLNPEIDTAQAAQRDRGRPQTALRDTVLQRAVDLVTAISFYQSKK
jgi:Periplasmic protease